MWFAKWFGGRGKASDADGDEPARFAPVEPRKPAEQAAAPQPQKNAAHKPAARPQKQGFDPYNSGAFERQNAWERVIRR